jgi:hypothetical protein
MQKKALFLLTSLIFSLTSLSSCSSSPTKVFIPYGSLYDESKTGDELFHSINYADLSGLMSTSSSHSFILLIRGVSDDCLCWTGLRSNLTSWMKSENAEVYLISSSEFSSNDNLGFSPVTGSNVLSIVNNGSVTYNEKIEDDSSLATDSSSFASWINERVSIGKFSFISFSQLKNLYFGKDKAAFMVGFVRSSCSDCSYLLYNPLPSFLEKNTGFKQAYLFDCDVEGVRLYEGSAPSSTSENGLLAMNQWLNFKYEYGLSSSSDNPFGYNEGYVPTFSYILPSNIGEHGYEGIVDMAVYANDSLASNSDGTYYVKGSYWDGSVDHDFLNDTKNLSANNVNYTNLTHLKSIPASDVNVYEGEAYWKHEAMNKYHFPILSSFFSEYLSSSSLAK